MKARLVVAVPVKNEEEHIGGCVRALLAQSVAVDDICLLLNNCTDGSRAAALAAAQGFAGLRIVERALRGAEASAGEARRLAMDHAAALAGDGLIFTTDADGAAPPYWIKENLAAFAAGAEVVCGRADVSAADAAAIPERLHQDHMREMACLTLLDEIDAVINPDVVDHWPRHREHSGASLAMTTAAFRRAGGAPRVSRAEDRILVERLALVDARIRHAPDVHVVVSGRLEGRAEGGMADTIKRRMIAPDTLADETLEPAVDAFRRALAKSRLRDIWTSGSCPAAMAADLLIAEAAMETALGAPYFGVAWAEVERQSPVLRRRRLAVADLARETRQAAALCQELRAAAESPTHGRAVAG